jgi:hypothetical protein
MSNNSRLQLIIWSTVSVICLFMHIFSYDSMYRLFLFYVFACFFSLILFYSTNKENFGKIFIRIGAALICLLIPYLLIDDIKNNDMSSRLSGAYIEKTFESLIFSIVLFPGMFLVLWSCFESRKGKDQ